MAAGLGSKTFTTGEVLTAADVNGYLMQGVLVFASAVARDAAITSPQEGQYAFLKDTDVTYYYDGAAWIVSGATGDITAVTTGASSGLAGGVTSGTADLSLSLQLNAQVDTYTLVAADRNKLVTMSKGTAVTITIPTGVFAAGEQINVQSIGVGLTTISGGAVTITSTGAGTLGNAPILRARFSAATIICTAAGVFTIIGDIS